MTWTTPRTWTDGELVTAAIMNAHVRDNLNSTWHVLARKSADESVTSSTALQDDNHLVLAVATNEVWQFQLMLLVEGSGGGINWGFTWPASGRLSARSIYTSGASVVTTAVGSATSPGTVGTVAAASVNATPNHTPFTTEGVFINSGTAGNLTVQWAQNSSSGIATTVKANSVLIGMKLA